MMVTNKVENSMKFSKASVEAYNEKVQEEREKERQMLASKKANELIKYIESRYEKKIKKSLSNGVNTHSINITLPYLKRIHNDDIFFMVDSLLKKHFNALGFTIGMYDGKHCPCLLDFICNEKEFCVKMYW